MQTSIVETSQTPTAPATPAPGSAPLSPPNFNLGAIGVVEELTQEEYLVLWTNEQIISAEFKNSIDVGLALLDIRNDRLYRMEYTSFPEYYRKKWHFDRNNVYKIIAPAEVYRSITKDTNLPAPEYAAQLWPLIGLTREQVLAAWEHITKQAGGGKITPRLVRAAVVELQLRPEAREKNLQVRQERAQRRQELSKAMEDLLELIVMRKPYEDLVRTASLLDQHLRFFFPKRGKRQP